MAIYTKAKISTSNEKDLNDLRDEVVELTDKHEEKMLELLKQLSDENRKLKEEFRKDLKQIKSAQTDLSQILFRQEHGLKEVHHTYVESSPKLLWALMILNLIMLGVLCG